MEIIQKILDSIGKPVEHLINSGLIEREQVEYLFEGDDTFSAEPEKGLLLAFDDITRALKSVQITIIDTTGDNETYRGAMPEHFSHSMSKESVRTLFGVPDESSGPITIPAIGVVGGGDVYLNRLSEYPGIQLRCLYTAEFLVHTIAFDAI